MNAIGASWLPPDFKIVRSDWLVEKLSAIDLICNVCPLIKRLLSSYLNLYFSPSFYSFGDHFAKTPDNYGRDINGTVSPPNRPILSGIYICMCRNHGESGYCDNLTLFFGLEIYHTADPYLLPAVKVR